MSKVQQVKFNNRYNKEFVVELKSRIDDYFKSNNISPYANTKMWVKIAFWLISWAATYLIIITGNFSGIQLFLLALAHGFTHLFIAFNISHDANHNAISRNRKVNRLLSYSLDLIGVNSFLWRKLHNDDHHGYVNIHGVDTSIEGYGVIRFSPKDPLKPFHRFQHIYALFLYGISTVNYVISKDFLFLYKLQKKGFSVPAKEWALLFIFKAFYYGYVFVLPVIILGIPFWKIFLVFLVVHFFVGVTLALVFQSGHLTEEAHFPEVEEGKVDDNWVVHVIRTTSDFGARKPWLSWFFGGINIHVIHHIFPHICHTHYDALAPILRKTAEEYGYVYRDRNSFLKAIASHFKFLRLYGQGKPIPELS
jgi:linoleoyl-CoA desaturase